MLDLFRPGFVEILRCGGGGGGGGGSDSGGGGGYTSIKDMFDGGGPGQSGSTFGGALGGMSNALGFSPVSPGEGSGSVYEGPTMGGGAGYVQDPGQMGVDTGTGFLTTDTGSVVEPPSDRGGYTSITDLFDGGGPGQSGDTFGGLLGGVSNTIGLTPIDPGPLSGGVYEGPNIDGSAGYLQDPGQMGVDTSTGFITSDENVFRPAPPEPVLPPIMEAPSEPPPDISPVEPVPPPAPVAPARVEPPPVSMGFLPPPIAQVGLDAVMGGAPAFGGDPRARPSDLGPFVFSGFRPDISPVEPVPPPPRPIPMPQPQPVSDMYGMPLALSAPAVRVPQLAQFFPPPVPPYTPAAERPAPIGGPQPISGVTPLPGPVGADGRLLGAGIASLMPPGGFSTLFG